MNIMDETHLSRLMMASAMETKRRMINEDMVDGMASSFANKRGSVSTWVMSLPPGRKFTTDEVMAIYPDMERSAATEAIRAMIRKGHVKPIGPPPKGTRGWQGYRRLTT